MEFLKAYLERLVDLLFPQEKLITELEKMSPADFLRLVPFSLLNDSNRRALFEYRHPLMRKAVWEIKYRNNRRILRLVTAAGAELLVPDLSDIQLFYGTKELYVIPIPLSPKRYRERGYNQAEEIAKEIMASLSLRDSLILKNQLLIKTLHTKAQTKIVSTLR